MHVEAADDRADPRLVAGTYLATRTRGLADGLRASGLAGSARVRIERGHLPVPERFVAPPPADGVDLVA